MRALAGGSMLLPKAGVSVQCGYVSDALERHRDILQIFVRIDSSRVLPIRGLWMLHLIDMLIPQITRSFLVSTRWSKVREMRHMDVQMIG